VLRLCTETETTTGSRGGRRRRLPRTGTGPGRDSWAPVWAGSAREKKGGRPAPGPGGENGLGAPLHLFFSAKTFSIFAVRNLKQTQVKNQDCLRNFEKGKEK
jgi:hypothetical protein